MRAFLDAVGVLDDTLLHDRAAIMLALYRIAIQGWSQQQALEELDAYRGIKAQQVTLDAWNPEALQRRLGTTPLTQPIVVARSV